MIDGYGAACIFIVISLGLLLLARSGDKNK